MSKIMLTVCALVLTIASTASGQRLPTRSFAELSRVIAPSDTVIVTRHPGRTIKGQVEQISDTLLVLRLGDQRLQIAESEVRRITDPPDHLWNGLILGFAAGFAFGAVATASDDCSGWGPCLGAVHVGSVFGAMGAGVGAVIDGLIQKQRLLFLPPLSASRSATIVPVVRLHEFAARVDLRF